MLDTIAANFSLFVMVFARMTGLILFNPILGRRNVPAVAKIGLALTCSVLMTSSLPDASPEIENFLLLLAAVVKELAVGLFLGLIMQLFLSLLLIGGDLVDLQMRISMSKIYDPASNASIALSGSLYQLMYITSFFAVNGHLTLFKVVYGSFQVLPAGAALLNSNAWMAVVLLFSNILTLALKLAMPIIAIEIVTEMGLGMLMRSTPQINIFVVGMQLKLLIGFAMIMIAFPALSTFFDTVTGALFETMTKGISLLAQG